jgi:hypothetical protein
MLYIDSEAISVNKIRGKCHGVAVYFVISIFTEAILLCLLLNKTTTVQSNKVLLQLIKLPTHISYMFRPVLSIPFIQDDPVQVKKHPVDIEYVININIRPASKINI